MNLVAPNHHALAVMLLVGLALVLFSRDRIPLETTSLMILAVLTVGFELFPYIAPDGGRLTPSDFFLGFGHQALVAVCALMILGQGLIRTGALEPVGRVLAIFWRKAPALSLLFTLLVCAFLSAFINNTPIVVMLLPILIAVSVRTKLSPSGMLLPVGLVSIIGGMATTIGTSTNLLVVGVAADLGMAPFQMFDFLMPAAIAGSVAVLYLWLIAPRLVPHRPVPMEAGVNRLYTAQIRLRKGSAAVGLTLADAIDKAGGNMKVEKIQRGPGVFVTPLPDVELKEGDRLTTTDTQENLRESAHALGGKLYSGEYEVDEDHPLVAEFALEAGLVDGIVMAEELAQGGVAGLHARRRQQGLRRARRSRGVDRRHGVRLRRCRPVRAASGVWPGGGPGGTRVAPRSRSVPGPRGPLRPRAESRRSIPATACRATLPRHAGPGIRSRARTRRRATRVNALRGRPPGSPRPRRTGIPPGPSPGATAHGRPGCSARARRGRTRPSWHPRARRWWSARWSAADP